MSNCPYQRSCTFFKDHIMDSHEDVKALYCKGIFNACARWKVKMIVGAKRVPDDLMPSQKDEAEKIIEGRPNNQSTTA